MKVFLTPQHSSYATHLQWAKNLPVVPYSSDAVVHKISSINIKGHTTLATIDARPLFEYRIFPPNILHAYCQWHDEGRDMQPGDVIVQEIYLPPLPKLSSKNIAAVRVKEVFNSDDCVGFSYETLMGHVEKGISSFKLKRENGVVKFEIETWSAPNGILLSLFAPFARLYQAYCTRQALESMVNQLSD